MKKLKLLFASLALLVGSGTTWAQTDVTSTYMTNPSFEAADATTGDISSTGEFTNDWNITSISYARVAIFNSSSTISTFGGTTSVSDGSYYLMIRSNLDQGKTQNIKQNSDMSLPKGKYSISFDYKAARVKNVSKKFVISAINSDGSTTYGSKSIDIPQQSASNSYFGGIDWSTASFEFVHENATNTRINISCETQGTANSGSSQHTVVLIDNFVINYSNINGPTLAALIAQANSINAAKGGLSDAITAAQNVYDNIDNTPTYQATIDDAITTLKNAITTKVAGISVKHNDDLSYLIANADFEGITAETGNYKTGNSKDYATDGWILSNTGDYGYGAVFEYEGGGQIVDATIPDIDNSGNKGKALGISVGWGGTQLYKTAPITLPAGKYKLKVYGYNAGAATTFTSKFGFVPTTGDATLSSKTSYTKNTWENEEVTIELASATEGCFQFGGVAVSGSGSGSTAKVFFDNITLTYIDELGEAQEQWQAAHDDLATLDATALPDAAEDAITDALADDEPTTVEGYNTAKANLQALIDSYDGIKSAYEKVNDLITNVTDVKNYSAGDKTDIEIAITTATTNKENRTTADDLTEDYNTLELARQTYVTSGAEPAENQPFECTFKIANPGFEDDGTASDKLVPTGWTIPNKGATYGTKAKGSIANAKGNYVFNNWVSWWNNLNVQQIVSDLPKGRYEVTAVLAGDEGVASKLEAGGGTTWRNMTGENNGIRVSVNGNVSGNSLTIKAETVGKEGGSLLIADDFTLSFIGNKPVLKNLLDSAEPLLTKNVGDGVFQIPSSAASTLSAAIADAQAVYDDNTKYGNDIQNAIDALTEAVETFKGAELNAPTDGKRYKLTLADRGTLTFQTASTEGGYGMPFTTTADYKAQAFTLTKVSGNNYTLSFIDLEGNTRYICTRADYGEGGTGTAGIRTTTDAEKALSITVKATSTDGVFNLLNTARDNAKLGSNGGDFYTDNTYTSWSFTEASQASVGIDIASDVKFGTRIFPFTPTLPDGVEAYTATVAGTALMLTKEETPAANKPYILYAASGYSGDALTGWGTAAATSYTNEVLTGVYVETEAPNDSYVLLKKGDKVGFHLIDNDSKPTVGAYRAYLTTTSGARVSAFFFDEETTGIKALEALTSGEVEFFDANGVKQPALRKGLNIVKTKNGKTHKVMVK